MRVGAIVGSRAAHLTVLVLAVVSAAVGLAACLPPPPPPSPADLISTPGGGSLPMFVANPTTHVTDVHSLTITNVGGSPSSPISITPNQNTMRGTWTLENDSCSGKTLAAHATCAFTIRFASNVPRTVQDAFIYQVKGGFQTLNIYAQGTAIPSIRTYVQGIVEVEVGVGVGVNDSASEPGYGFTRLHFVNTTNAWIPPLTTELKDASGAGTFTTIDSYPALKCDSGLQPSGGDCYLDVRYENPAGAGDGQATLRLWWAGGEVLVPIFGHPVP